MSANIDKIYEQLKGIDSNILELKKHRLMLMAAAAIELKQPYVHKEAFNIMTYECEGCGTKELLWNSRDGVTPFSLNCATCGNGTMKHIDWEKDLCDPDHIPERGSRVFIDMSPELLQITIRKYVERIWDHPDMPASKNWVNKAEAIKALSQDNQPGEPYILTV